jgi:hypothetical protein
MHFRIQYISNLCLYDKVAFPLFVKPKANYLALAGNIGQPGSRIHTSFLDYCSNHWERIFYVPGPLEHTQFRILENVVRTKPRITLLNETNFHFKNVSMVGASNCTNPSFVHELQIHSRYCNYQNIPICMISFNNPIVKNPFIQHPSIKAWIYGDAERPTSGFYNHTFYASNSAFQRDPASSTTYLEFPLTNTDSDKPDGELSYSAALLE